MLVGEREGKECAMYIMSALQDYDEKQDKNQRLTKPVMVGILESRGGCTE